MPYYASKKSPTRNTSVPDTAKPAFNRRRWGLLAALLFLAGAVAFAAWRYWPVSAPDPARDFAAATRFAASTDFRRLSPEAQKQFMRDYRDNRPKDRAQRPELSESQRQQLRSNMGQIGMAMIAERAREYLALSPTEKTAYLKKQNAEFNERMRNFQPPQRPQQRQEGTPPPAQATPERGPNRRLQMFKDSTPAERAQVSAYMRALRKARGNQPPQRHR